MSNLLDELGAQYMVDRFSECMFYDADRRVSVIDSSLAPNWNRDNVGVITLTGDVSNVTQTRGAIPKEFFKDMSVFGAPDLGWRMAAQGKYLAHFRRNNKSYHRAVAAGRRSNLLRTLSPVTQYMVDSENLNEEYYNSMHVTTMLIMQPSFIPFRQGLELMRRGELLSFCVSPNIAVIPDTKGRQSILFNTARVAMVEADGEVKFTTNKQPFIEEQL